MPAEHPALFLDRDGVVNEEIGYLHRVEDFRFLPGVLAACRRFHEAGYLLVVITNQAGIARGYYSESDFHALTRWMRVRFQEAGAPLAGVYHCPHHPDGSIAEFRKTCDCRKPAPGLIIRARDELNIDLRLSILAGDKDSDILAGQAAGVGRCYLIGNPERGFPSLAGLADSLL